ncbi:flagellar brake protein [Oceanobacter mangrovi]|uniref:flagellar brake protein n=1 Tax=Oceanobacter mangrovi TaxID=2862510 RepID=UPI001C8CF58A|nr:flagellar brake protein [Oceanobacter mangrovi]
MQTATSDFTQQTTENTLVETIDIYGALRALVLFERPVRLFIDGSNETYSAEIRDVQLKSRSFFLSDILPESGAELIRSGKRFRIECENQGASVRFVADGRLRFQPANNEFRGEFPSQVEYLQRRGAYRVAVPDAHPIQVNLPDQRDQSPMLVTPTIAGRLQDLSESGFKAIFQGDIMEELRQLNPIHGAEIRFNREHHMDCSLELKHLILDRDGNTLAGYVFLQMSSAAQRYIRKLITDFQWEERQARQQDDEPPLQG